MREEHALLGAKLLSRRQCLYHCRADQTYACHRRGGSSDKSETKRNESKRYVLILVRIRLTEQSSSLRWKTVR